MSISWMYAYAFPPFLMLGRVIGLEELHRDHPCKNDPDCPEMAQSVLVCQTDRAAGRFSFGPAAQERSHDPAPQPPETSVATSSAPTRLETVQRSFQAKGFSRTVAGQISRGRRQSSRAVYDSTWMIFSVCCGERSNPLKVSVQALTEFPVYLFDEKGNTARAIKGYRSAISSTISSIGSRTECTDSYKLSFFIQSFQIERPQQHKLTRQLNLSLVLQALLKQHFEPIHASELKSPTLKSVFL